MLSVSDALRSETGFPVKTDTIETIALKRGLSLDGDATQAVILSKEFRICVADLCLWLFIAPNVSQGGQSFSLTDAQREELRRRARRIYKSLGMDESGAGAAGATYGYKGEWL